MTTENEETVTNKFGTTMRVKSIKVHEKLPREDPEPAHTIVQKVPIVKHSAALQVKKPTATDKSKGDANQATDVEYEEVVTHVPE